jgi:hypothetical protein
VSTDAPTDMRTFCLADGLTGTAGSSLEEYESEFDGGVDAKLGLARPAMDKRPDIGRCAGG